jgi:hypothetical protein
MKTLDLPFTFDMGRPSAKTFEIRDELKAVMAKLIGTAEPEKVKALEAGKVYDMAGIGQYSKDLGAPEDEVKKNSSNRLRS